jgi:hypothetical protein
VISGLNCRVQESYQRASRVALVVLPWIIIGNWETPLKDSEIAALLGEGATVLFQQQNYSNAYTIIGDSEIAEANIVVHISSAFIKQGHAVWAESPFKVDLAERTKHVDLYVDLEPGTGESPDILLVEAKRIAPGEENDRIASVIRDYGRLRNWPSDISSSLFSRPGIEIERVRGALVVLLANEEVDRAGAPLSPRFSEWWKNSTAAPPSYSADLLRQMRAILQKGAIPPDVAYSRFFDGGIRLAVAYAIFDLS